MVVEEEMLISTIWSDHTVITVIRYGIKDLRGQNLKCFTFDISKTTNILQSIIDEKLFRIKFLTICTFHFAPVWPLYGVTGSAPKNYLYRLLKNSKEFLNSCWTRKVEHHKTFRPRVEEDKIGVKGNGHFIEGPRRV